MASSLIGKNMEIQRLGMREIMQNINREIVKTFYDDAPIQVLRRRSESNDAYLGLTTPNTL